MKIIKQIIFVTVFFSFGILVACWSADPNKKTRSTSSSPSPAASSTNPSDSKSPSPSPGDSNNKVNNTSNNPPKSGGFQGNLPSGFQMPTDEVGQRMLKEYGAMFVARGVTPPNTVVF